MKKATFAASPLRIIRFRYGRGIGWNTVDSNPTLTPISKSTPESALSPGRVVGMGDSVLALDTILSTTFYFSVKWSSDLQSNKARDLLRFLLCRLYDEGRGQLVNTQLTLAQTTLARKLGISRQWVGVLLERLEKAGWIEYAAPWVGPGMRGSTSYRIGRTLKRLLVMLAKTRRGKAARKSAAKPTWQFSPTKLEKEKRLILARENQPPTEAQQARMPLLKRWMGRGQPAG